MTHTDETLQMFKELTEAAGVPGQEEEARAVMARYLAQYGEVSYDRLGSVAARKVGLAGGPRILVAGHLDEVGFMVNRITDDGFLKFAPLGGWWEQVMLAQRVIVKTHKGDLVGVIGSKPPHILPPEERKKPVEKKNMFIDIGVASKEEAIAAGVRPGDPVVPVCPFTVLANPKYLLAKAWDNRIGCALAIEVLKRLQGEEHPNEVFGAGTVMEETTLAGAQTLPVHVEADVAFAVDVGIAGDTPGVSADDAQSKQGKGPQILLSDGGMQPHLGLRNLVVDTAEALGIPYQYETLAGGTTDAARFHKTGRGIPSLAIGIPARYIHSAAAIIHRDDFENAAKLLVAVIKKLDAATVAGLRP